MSRRRRHAVVVLPGSCELRCVVCECTGEGRQLQQGAERLLIRGDTRPSESLELSVVAARKAGTTEVIVRTNAIAYAEDGRARWLARLGVDAVRVPLFSHAARVHDRIAGRSGALMRSLIGVRALVDAGLGLEVEVPLLTRRLQQLDRVVELAVKAAPRLRALRFFVPTSEEAQRITAAWPEVGPALARAAQCARRHDVAWSLGPAEAVVACAIAPEHHARLRLDRRARQDRAHPELPCGGCALRSRCAGVPAAHLRHHGVQGLAAFQQVPSALAARPRRKSWSNAQRTAAAHAELLVLRPTVSCNQDCTFCSAGETSKNVWTRPGDMLRAVARAAQRGVTHLSFSGGEPTLAPALPDWVAAARRLGIPKVELVTNGVLVNESRARALWEAGLTHAFVSLHAHEESRSAVITRKRGDFERTVRAIGALSSLGVRTAVNHVVCSQNVHDLEDFVGFVHEQFRGHVLLSFSFLTPQFRALDDLSQMPRLSDATLPLRRALRRALELGQPVSVGSRQGIPPCFLHEFRAWSDVLYVAHAARSEDADQKVRAPACEACQYSPVCTGVWKPYAQQHGLDELSAVPGPPITEADRDEFFQTFARTPWGVPSGFEQVPERHRDRAAESAVLASPAPATRPRRLVVVGTSSVRPLRALLLGAGRRARQLVREASAVGDMQIAAVASPSGPKASAFGGCPTYSDAATAIGAQRPDLVVIAAATAAHLELAEVSLGLGIPTLIEKPLASTPAEAQSIVELAFQSTAAVMPMHQLVFAPGIERALDAGMLRIARRTPRDAPDAPRRWHRRSLLESLHHLLALAVAQAAGGPLEVVSVAFSGGARPSRVTAELSHDRGRVVVNVDWDAAEDELALVGDAVQWRRRGRATEMRSLEAWQPLESAGSDVAAMLAHFCGVVRGTATARVTLQHGANALSAAREVVLALEAAGAPFSRKGAPRRAASPDLRDEV